MIEVTDSSIDVAAVRAAVSSPAYGAVLVFEGVARDSFEGRGVVRLEYEAYATMAIGEMRRIAQEVRERWPEAAVAMVHRTGVVPITEASVVIAVGTPHRAACYDASRYAIDTLKERVPVWKKEVYADGSEWKANAPG